MTTEQQGLDEEFISKLAASGRNGLARRAALAPLQDIGRTPTTVVTYHSRGSLLVLGDEHRAGAACEELLDSGLHCTLLLSDGDASEVSLRTVPNAEDCVSGQVTHLAGHLGSFVVRLKQAEGEVNLARLVGHERDDFDLVLDLGRTPRLNSDLLPPGYFAPRDNADYTEALAELPGLVGEFDKPRYFRYDPDICAHGARGIGGCTRCLDTCPTEAIRSLGERIEVDPYLCQGGGVCATACPSGAITYAYPKVDDLLDDLRRMLHRYHDEGGELSALLFHDREDGWQALAGAAAELPEHVIPVAVEEIGSVGMETWLSVLAYGAHQVLLWVPAMTPAGVAAELERQVGIAEAMLTGMGYPQGRIEILSGQAGSLPALLPATPTQPLATAAGFAGLNEKRTTIRLAMDHLFEHAPRPKRHVDLPAGAPFGQVKVDRNACTLCMACASVCPVSALQDGDGLPRLMFVEGQCVQCGVCLRSCPEQCIELAARFTYDAEERTTPRVLNEEEPFHCVSCGKPFTTRSMMERMREKLHDHWMYREPAQRRRLEMCENCRVQDMYLKGGQLDPYQGPDKPTGSKV